MKLKIIYGLLCVSILGNMVLFDTLGKTVAEVKLLQDKTKIQSDYGVEMLKELMAYKQSEKLINDLKK